MANADLAFGVLGTELWSTAGLGLGRQAYSRFGRRGLLEFGGRVLTTARDWLTETFDDEAAHGLLAPWVLHTGLGPDQATSGFMTQVIACALQLGGMPVPKGGGVKLVEGLATIVREAGGELRTESEVERIVVSDGRATGVRLAGGETIAASRAVLACVTPTQLYGRLLGESDAPPNVRDAARRFRYGRGEMQIHLALDELPRWRGDERLGAHADRARHARPRRRLARGQRGRARPAPGRGDDRLRAAARGRSVARAGGQGDPLDPAPGAAVGAEGRCRGRARRRRTAGTSSCARRTPIGSSSGSARHIENLELGDDRPGRARPAEIAAANPNWVGGDIYGGSCALDQNLLWRPTPATPGHETPVEGLFHIGASTHPGPGLGAGSGYLAAKRLTRPPLPRRLLSKLPGVSDAAVAERDLDASARASATTSRAYAAAGFDGIGIWESKLGDDEADLAALRASGLRATNCVPLVPSILPNPVIEGPLDVEERIESICASMVRFARYEPESVLLPHRPGR